jgi:hypothetical protein
MGGACGAYGGEDIHTEGFGEEPEVKKKKATLKNYVQVKNIIKKEVKEIKSENEKWIYFPQVGTCSLLSSS